MIVIHSFFVFSSQYSLPQIMGILVSLLRWTFFNLCLEKELRIFFTLCVSYIFVCKIGNFSCLKIYIVGIFINHQSLLKSMPARTFGGRAEIPFVGDRSGWWISLNTYNLKYKKKKHYFMSSLFINVATVPRFESNWINPSPVSCISKNSP